MKTKRFFKSVTLLLIINVLLLHCKKDEGGITSKFYFTANIDGKSVVYQDGKNGYGSGAGLSSGTTPSGCEYGESLNLTRVLVQTDLAGVVFLKTFSDCYTDCDMVRNIVHTGNYTYGKQSTGSNYNGIDGVVIYYVDSEGVYWATDKGSADQTNSTFSVTEHIDNTDYYSEKITKAVFHCMLYDGDGNSMALTNGEIRSRSVICY